MYWALHYLNNRLREINEEATLPPSQPRRRSNSLPIPQIEVSLYQGPGNNSEKGSPSNGSVPKEYIEVPEPPTQALLGSYSSNFLTNVKTKHELMSFR